ncbi:hypothetical protein D3C73_1410020 [compost metagenome]
MTNHRIYGGFIVFGDDSAVLKNFVITVDFIDLIKMVIFNLLQYQMIGFYDRKLFKN